MGTRSPARSMSPPSPPDPLGHDLLAERLARLPSLLADLASTPLTRVTDASRAGRHFVVTGTGSSEAHARFLVNLLNRCARRPAEFVPLSAFCELPADFGRGRVLLVVSQGLSPNAQVAIDRHHDFDHLVVFTSTTAAGAAAGGKPDRARKIQMLADAGVEFVHSPLEEEYATLIRFIGPLAVYVRAHQFVRCLAPAALAPLTPERLAPLLSARAPADLVARFAMNASTFCRGFYLVTGAPLVEFAQNLSYKFLEGLYWSAPVIWDYLQFAHGPFQEVTLQPRPVVLLAGPGTTEGELARRTRAMLHAAGVPAIDVVAASAAPWSIIEYEAIFNDLVFQLIRRLGVDQRHWPSKGKDDPLYGFFRVG